MIHLGSNVLADRFGASRSALKDLLWIVAFSLLTGALAQVRIPLPGSPVPLTGQTFGVLLCGAVLGSRRAFLSQALYLAEGAAGLPVFAGGSASVAHLVGPTGGYLWSFPVAAALLGWLVERGASRSTGLLAGALALADSFILAVGASWLHYFFRVSSSQAWIMGFYPFLIGDILKITLVGLSLPYVLKRFDSRH